MKKIITSICFGVVCSGIFALDAQKIVSEKVYSQLKAKGKLERSVFNKPELAPVLFPNTSMAKKAVEFWPSTEEKPVYFTENLYLVSKKDLDGGDGSKVTINAASKVLRAVSKMEGLEYYSSTAKKIKTLYKRAYTINNTKDKLKIADDLEGSADGKKIYCLQEDNSFGEMVYDLTYSQSENEIFAGFKCVTPVSKGPIRAINANNLRISVLVTDCGEDLMVYLLCRAVTPKIAMFEGQLNESFSTRLDAIYKWFFKQW